MLFWPSHRQTQIHTHQSIYLATSDFIPNSLFSTDFPVSLLASYAIIISECVFVFKWEWQYASEAIYLLLVWFLMRSTQMQLKLYDHFISHSFHTVQHNSMIICIGVIINPSAHFFSLLVRFIFISYDKTYSVLKWREKSTITNKTWKMKRMKRKHREITQ